MVLIREPNLKESNHPKTRLPVNNRSSYFKCTSLVAVVYVFSHALTAVTGDEFLGERNQFGVHRHLIGVHPERRVFYDLDHGQLFKCLDGSGSISLDLVNDDYCDCKDSSDEPGTAACPKGEFYCINQGYIPKLIPSAWVNDGRCDCCDGTDEHNSSTTCINDCGVLGENYRIEQERNKEISNQGSAIRSQYKEQARQRKQQNAELLDQYRRELSEKEQAIKKLEEDMNSDFGPDNVFFALKGQCYPFKDREYTYTLCPFERATQESTTGMQTELGRWSGWATSSESDYAAQKYEGGIQCWNGPARSALVKIACGVEDKLISVTEPSKCEYVFEFITPAACPDLDPPASPESAIDEQTTTLEPSESIDTGLETEYDQLDPDALPTPPVSDDHTAEEHHSKDPAHEEL